MITERFNGSSKMIHRYGIKLLTDSVWAKHALFQLPLVDGSTTDLYLGDFIVTDEDGNRSVIDGRYGGETIASISN